MREVMRSVVHLGVAASLLFAFEQAPFQHIHETDPHHDHAHGFAHLHWETFQHDGQVIHAEDHDSGMRMVDWLAGDGTSLIKFVPGLPQSVLAPKVVVLTDLVLLGETHNHDPPFLAPLTLRGPPA